MIWPSVADERAAALRELVPDTPLTWRRHGLVLRVVFFILTCVLATALLAFLRLLTGSDQYVITAAILIAVAEWLILRKRFFWTGIELALWLCAMLYLVFSLPSSGKPEALLVVGGAIGIGAARVRNPLFGAVAICFVVGYAHVKTHGSLAPFVIAFAIGILAALALGREWRRRSTERFLQALALVVPPLAYAICSDSPKPFAALAFALMAVVLGAIAITRRDRVLAIAATIDAVIVGIEFARPLHIAYEYKLIDGGIVALAVAIALSRTLRSRTRGFIASPEAGKDYEDALQLLGAMHVTHAPARDSSTADFEAGGGSFGGAGASGNY